jgi:hypothetical protein
VFESQPEQLQRNRDPAHIWRIEHSDQFHGISFGASR